MNNKIFLSCLFLIMQAISTNMFATIGDWKAYMAYYNVKEIEQGNNNMIYVLASDGLYSYNKGDQSIQTYDKTNALSDCSIAHIKWNNNTKSLIIVYSNANIDIMLQNGDVVNIPDFYSKSMTDIKTTNDIYIYGKHALLATAFGIVDVDMAQYNISNTYNLGKNINYCYVKDNAMYAVSRYEGGVFSCNLRDNMLDKNNWKNVSGWVAKQEEDKTELKNIVSSLLPGGPKYNIYGMLKYKFGRLYTCGGSFGLDRIPGSVQIWDGNEWTIYQDDLSSIDNIPYLDNVAIAIDPKNADHVFTAGRTGVYEFLNGNIKQHFTEGNSPFSVAATISAEDPYKLQYLLTEGIEFDAQGNLWALSSQTSPSKPNLYEYTNNDWLSWTKSNLIFNNSFSLSYLSNIMFDSRGLMWFVNNDWRTPSAYCYQPSTSNMNSYTTFVNQDGTSITITYVRCVTEDKNGDMWIGTNQGPLLLEQTKLTDTNPLFTQVKVPRNDGTNYADYLLSGVDISCIAIDGGNRKWFGTYGNGVYLISSDNIQQLQHFTSENSSLLSNNIHSIAINDNTGEVFFSTENGLCSYMSDASIPSEKMDKDNVYAYPNPVKPDYTGLITIVGLSNNADVKIATSNGVLVAEGRSNGGTFTWDGNDKSGKRVASGIYMVEAATETGEKGTVCKIAIIR